MHIEALNESRTASRPITPLQVKRFQGKSSTLFSRVHSWSETESLSLFEYTREVLAVAMLALVPSFAAIAWSAVRRERNRQLIELPEAPKRPADIDLDYHASGVFYVSTTFADSPLRRVWAHGLGSRGRAHVVLGEDALSIFRQGEVGLEIPWERLKVSTERATIDRGTERDGLLVMEWELCGRPVTTSLRFVSADLQRQITNNIRERINASSK